MKGPSGPQKSPLGRGRAPPNRSGARPPQAALCRKGSASPPARCLWYQPLNLLISTPRNKREELNGIPSPGHPRSPPPPPLPLPTPHKSFSELLRSHTGPRAGAKGKFGDSGDKETRTCVREMPGSRGKGQEIPEHQMLEAELGQSRSGSAWPPAPRGLRGQRWGTPAGDTWTPFPSPPAPSRPLLEEHPGVSAARLPPKPPAATGQHGVNATSTLQTPVTQDGWTDGQNSHEHDPEHPASLHHLDPLRALRVAPAGSSLPGGRAWK